MGVIDWGWEALSSFEKIMCYLSPHWHITQNPQLACFTAGLYSPGPCSTLSILALLSSHTLLIINWNTKVGRQELPGVTGKFDLGIQNKAVQRLIEFCQEHALVTAKTLHQQHKRRLYTRTSPNGQYKHQIDYILCSQRWRTSIQSAKTRLGLTVAQIMNCLLSNSDLNWRK